MYSRSVKPLSWTAAAHVGCVLAAYVVERVGTQEYSFSRQAFLNRLGQAYGDHASAEVAGWLAPPVS